jgi:hypothetical protein
LVCGIFISEAEFQAIFQGLPAKISKFRWDGSYLTSLNSKLLKFL